VKALVVCTGGGIGDVLLATPMMRALHSRYDEIVALTTFGRGGILRGNPDISEVWFDEGNVWKMSRRIAAAHFDASITTWATMRTALLPYLGGVRTRVGQTRRLYSGLFTHRIAVRSEFGDRTTHWTRILLDFSRALECDIADATPVFVVDSQARAEAHAALEALGVRPPFAILHPTRGISERRPWPTQRLGEAGKALGERLGVRILVSGSERDRAITEDVARLSGGVSLAGKMSLAAFAATAQRARCVVAMDSGPMHLAAAVGAPTVGIFAMQCDEPDRWAPLGPRAATVRATYPCPPGHRKENCPDFACVRELSIENILKAVDGLLSAVHDLRRPS
jgi:ADP-heptose:LPS heptosyltransferase